MSRRRGLLFGILCAVCLLAGAAVVARGEVHERHAENELEQATRNLAGAAPMTRGTIVFRNVDQRRPSFYGFIGRAALDDPAAREIVPLPCARIYFAADRGLCLEPAGAILKQKVTILDRRLKPVESLTLRGIPNRARISPDGHYGAVTFFVTGHSYADPGSFSTETTLIDLRSGKAIANLEDFDVTHDGEKLESPRQQFLGCDVRGRQRSLLRHPRYPWEDISHRGVGLRPDRASPSRERRVSLALARRYPDCLQRS